MNVQKECKLKAGWFLGVDTKARFRAAAMLLAGAAAVVVLAVWHPGGWGWFPACPVREHTGLYCPGCGSLRACHHTLNGRFFEGFGNNPLLIVIGFPLALWFWAEQVMMVVFGRRFRPILRGSVVAWLALGVLLVFTVLRNLPADPLNVLRPPEVNGALSGR